MVFEIQHSTIYTYSHPAAEAYVEARLCPPRLPSQDILQRELIIQPGVRTSPYEDHFGNHVEFFSLPYRHKRLEIHSRMLVETLQTQVPEDNQSVSLQEARQIMAHQVVDIYPYLQLTPIVTSGRDAAEWARRIFHSSKSLGECCRELCSEIYKTFEYKSGSTTNSTPLAEVWKHRRGVCQDFAHIALSILRTARIPCRYVCGFIETNAPANGARLVGSLAKHAWIEVLLPGLVWMGIDPTNNQLTGHRHVAMTYGRDFSEAAPIRGTFKGSGGQNMKVKVRMRRVKTVRESS